MAGLGRVEVLQPGPDLGVAQRRQAGPLQLAGALAGAAEQGADLLQGPGLARVQPEAQDQHLALAHRQVGQGPVEGVAAGGPGGQVVETGAESSSRKSPRAAPSSPTGASREVTVWATSLSWPIRWTGSRSSAASVWSDGSSPIRSYSRD